MSDMETAKMVTSILIAIIGGMMTILQYAIFYMLRQIKDRINEYVTNNDLEHDRLWKRIDYHKHDKLSGDVILSHENKE